MQTVPKTSQSSVGWQKQRAHLHEGHTSSLASAGRACGAAENQPPKGLQLICSSQCSQVDGPLHAMVPDMCLICMTVLWRAACKWSNAKHADKGKGSDLEMTKWSKARSKDEAAEEKHLHGYIDKARQAKVMGFVWYSWCNAGVAKCLWLGQKLCRLAARRLISRCPEVEGGGGYTWKEKKATLFFHHVEYYIKWKRRTVLNTVTASWQQAQSCQTILSSLSHNS